MSARETGHIVSFLIAFLGGTAAIVLLRMVIPDPPWVGVLCAAVVVSGAIAVLGFHYYRSYSPDDLDRAGDNLYYLGFLFTLISLIYALVDLFLFEDRNTALTLAERTYILIGSFGIALLSTIAGILGRVILHDGSKGRKALGEAQNHWRYRSEARASEQAAGRGASRYRNEGPSIPYGSPESGYHRNDAVLGDPDIGLHLFIQRLRAEIRGATDAFSHFNRMTMFQAEDTKRHAERMTREFSRRLETNTQDAVARTGDAYRSLVDQAHATSDTLEDRVGEAVGAVATVLEQLSSAGHVLSELPTNVEQARRSMDELGEAAKTATARLNDETSEVREACETLARTAHEQRNIVTQNIEFAGTLSTLIEQLGAASRSFAEISDKMEQTRIGVTSINDSMNAIVTGLDDKTGELTRASESLTRVAHEQRVTIEQNMGISSAFTSLAGQLELVGQSLAALPASIERAQQSMDAFGKTTDDSKSSIHIKAGEVVGTFETLAHSVHEQQQLMERILEAGRTMNIRMDSEGSEWIRSFEELRIAFKDVPQAASALAALVEQLESAARSLATFSADMRRIEQDRSAPAEDGSPATATFAEESAVTSPRRLVKRGSWFKKKT